MSLPVHFLFILPAAAALLAAGISPLLCRLLLVGLAVLNAGAVFALWPGWLQPGESAWLGLDAPGKLVLTIVAALFLAAAVYCAGFLRGSRSGETATDEPVFLFRTGKVNLFVSAMLFFLAAMNLLCLARHFGLMWVALEATTLSSVPLIYFYRHKRSLEAVWKYLIICSVAIALAMLGNFFLTASAEGIDAEGSLLAFSLIHAHAAQLDPVWLKAAFALCVVGYGTKMGLAPMHSWMPETYAESPAPVAALLAGGLEACAFLALLRMVHVMNAAGLAGIGGNILIGLGLFSLGVAAAFLIRQANFKRMLAYSSVEHMGIAAMAVGLGGSGFFAGAFHAINHSLVKAALFLAAGNIFRHFHADLVSGIHGLRRRLPATALLWMAGILAVCGLPPFGMFMSELLVLRRMLEAGHGWLAALFLFLLSVVFIAISATVFRMVYKADEAPVRTVREPLWSWLPPALLLLPVLLFGLHLPGALTENLQQIAAYLEVHP